MKDVSTPQENENSSIFSHTLEPVDQAKLLLQMDKNAVKAILDSGAQHSFISNVLLEKYFYFKKQQSIDINVLTAVRQNW